MKLARVIGNVVATIKDPHFRDKRLLLLQPVDSEGNPVGKKQVGIDTVDAGEGDFVLFVNGSSARRTGASKNHPADCAVIGIVDDVEIKTVKKKTRGKRKKS